MSDETAPDAPLSAQEGALAQEDQNVVYEPLRPLDALEGGTFEVGDRVTVHLLAGEHDGEPESVRYGRVIRFCRREPGRVHVEYENKIPRLEYCLPEDILTKIEGES